jgi:taurine dioxygenase
MTKAFQTQHEHQDQFRILSLKPTVDGRIDPVMEVAMTGCIEAERLSEHIGGAVKGFDVRTLSPGPALDEVLALLWRHHVLVFRDQVLTADELLTFTRLLGEIDGTHVQSEFTLPGYPDVFVISNKTVDGKPLGTRTVGHHWHTDWCYKAFPASFTLLYGVEVPAQPHHTLFASQRRVYEELTEVEKADLRGRTGTYFYEKTHSAKTWYQPLTETQKAKTPPVSHPMLRIHPGTGKESLYVNRADCIGVSGMSNEDGIAYVNRLVERIVDPRFTYAHRWEPLDLVIWDNRVLLHAATPYDMDGDRRFIYRTTTKGERPIPPAVSSGTSVAV